MWSLKRMGRRDPCRCTRARNRRIRGTLPERQAPQLCSLVAEPPEGEEWIPEIKFDGYRLLPRSKTERSAC